MEEPYIVKIRYYDPVLLLRAVCELANANVSGIVIGGRRELREAIAPLVTQLRLPLISAETRPAAYNIQDDRESSYLHFAYPRRSHMAAFGSALHGLGWGNFLTLYDDEGALEELLPLLHQLSQSHGQGDPDRISVSPDKEQVFGEGVKVIKVNKSDALSAAKRLNEMARNCIERPHCPSLRVILHLKDELILPVFVVMLRCGLIRHDVELATTSGALDQLDLSWINQNMATLSGMVPRGNDNESQLVEESVRLAWASDQHLDPFFPRTEVLAMAEAVRGFVTAIKALKNSPRRPGWKIATLDRRLVARCSPRSPTEIYHSLPSNFTAAKWGKKLAKHLRFTFTKLDEFQAFRRLEMGPDGILRDIGGWRHGATIRNESEIAFLLSARRLMTNQKKFHLRVTSIEERPYLILHRHRHSIEPKGFCMDLLRRLSRDLGFTFSLQLVKDGHYGSWNNTSGKWNGLIGEILAGDADLAIAPLTINYERAQAVEFTAPFLQHGVAMLLRVPTAHLPSIVAFLSPLSWQLWVAILMAFFSTIAVTFVVVLVSPYERTEVDLHEEIRDDPLSSEQIQRKLADQQAFNMMKSINRANLAALKKYENGGPGSRGGGKEGWRFPWSVLFNSSWYITCILFMTGCDFGPKAISTRFLSGIFWIFCLVIGATYTAEFASVLTIDMRTLPVTSFEQLANQTEYAFGALRGGSTLQFLKESEFGSFHLLHNRMTANPEWLATNNAEAVRRVLNSRYIYLMESTSIEYEVLQNCNLTQVSNMVLGSRGYGIALKKGSPWTDKISQRIRWYADEGFIEHTKRMWWRSSTFCDRNDAAVKGTKQKLEMKHVVGLFIILVSGLAVASVVTIIEVLHARCLRRKEIPSDSTRVKFGHQFSTTSSSTPNEKRRRLSSSPSSTYLRSIFRNSAQSTCEDCDLSHMAMTSRACADNKFASAPIPKAYL